MRLRKYHIFAINAKGSNYSDTTLFFFLHLFSAQFLPQQLDECDVLHLVYAQGPNIHHLEYFLGHHLW